MASASALSSPFLSGLHRSEIKYNFLLPFQIRKNANPIRSPISTSSSSLSPSSSSSWEEREEIRWLREEQRWLREEKRWVREESWWRSERESLIREIAASRLMVEALERGKSLDASMGSILDVGGGSRRLELAEEAEVKEMILEARVSEGKDGSREEEEVIVKKEEVRGSDEGIREEMEAAKKKARRTLRKGSEGDDVRTLQDGTNGAASGSMAEIAETKETMIKEGEVYEHNRVFLLGENRWEEPSRLKGSKVTSPAKCLNCLGAGRLMCTECGGSGEPSIEPQFLEWVEGAKCPYCGSQGYTVCDVCEGSGAAAVV